MSKCEKKCVVYSRVVGYHRPVEHWNKGKKAEFFDRKTFCMKASLESKYGRTLEAFNSKKEVSETEILEVKNVEV